MPVMAVNNQNQHESTGDYRSRPRWSAGKKTVAAVCGYCVASRSKSSPESCTDIWLRDH
jgi:hypothetical protein